MTTKYKLFSLGSHISALLVDGRLGYVLQNYGISVHLSVLNLSNFELTNQVNSGFESNQSDCSDSKRMFLL